MTLPRKTYGSALKTISTLFKDFKGRVIGRGFQVWEVIDRFKNERRERKTEVL